MPNLMRRDPWRQLQDDVNALTQWLEPRGGYGRESEALGWQPLVDVYEDNEGVLFKFEIPEVDPKDIAVNIENGVLTVRGERKLEAAEKKDAYHRIERFHGAFTRSFSLPALFDFERVTAETKNGVLRVSIPKRAEAKPRNIQVKVQQ